MKIKIIAFGKFKSSQEYRQIFEYYKKRINFDIKLIELKSLLKPKKLEKEIDFSSGLKLNGALEIAPKLDLSSRIVDLVSTEFSFTSDQREIDDMFASLMSGE